MKCVLYDSTGDSFDMNGSVINAIEYFLYLYEVDRSVMLILINGTGLHINFICDLIDQRYDVSGIGGYVDNIVAMSLSELVLSVFDISLISNAMTMKRVRGVIRSSRIVVISDRKTHDLVYTLDKGFYNVVYYGEMPFEYRDVVYKMKFLFHRYKPLGEVEDATYVSTHIKDAGYINKVLGGNTNHIIRRSSTNVGNFMSKFSRMTYIVSPERCDPSPRSFIECKFYGKPVEYINPQGIRDGSWYRYQDYLNEPIEDRYFSLDDPIVREFYGDALSLC